MKIYQINGKPSEANSWIWTNEANFDNNLRWSNNKTKPCQGQTVNFSANQPVSVMIRESFTVGVLNLPNNGEIILSDNIQIGVDPSLSNCMDTQPITYSSEPDSWYLASNWLNQNLGQLEFVTDERSIPCQNDQTTLPQVSQYPLIYCKGCLGKLYLRKQLLWLKVPHHQMQKFPA